MSLPLNLVIDRTADGKLRAEVAGHPNSAVFATDLSGLWNAVEESFLQSLTADSSEAERSVAREATGRIVPPAADVEASLTDEEDQALRRVAMERMPDRETLKKLVSRHKVPDHWPGGMRIGAMARDYGSIVLAPVPDGHGHMKIRPVVILTSTENIQPGRPIDVACVTTHVERPIPPHHIPLPWHRARRPRTGLDKPNVVKCDWLASNDEDDFIRDWGLFLVGRCS